MTTVTLVRHGETAWHAENRYAGSSDIPLSPRGAEQAELLARWAARAGMHAVVASDLRRAQHTAAPAAAAAGLALRTEPRLREVDFGAGEGLTRDEMNARFPDALAAFHEAPADCPLPGGEPGTGAIRRAVPALRELIDEFPGGRVLVVGHSTLNRLLLCHLLGLDPNRYRTLFPSVRNVALTTMRVTADGAALLELNAPPRGDPASDAAESASGS